VNPNKAQIHNLGLIKNLASRNDSQKIFIFVVTATGTARTCADEPIDPVSEESLHAGL
jgi:hypothetical protein